MATGFVLDERYMRHDTGRGHPERPERIAVLGEAVRARPGLTAVAPRVAAEEDLARVHAEAYIERVAATRSMSSYAFDADTPVCPESYEIARLASGGVLALVDEVMAGRLQNGFAFVRPPGHHAERGRAMGFCLFNNVAVAAAYLRERHGLERVLVMDWDVHHGNGTQHIFEHDPGVLYISTHQYPYYPGTGWIDEVGSGEGSGFTVNVPLPAGCGDREYLTAFAEIIEPIARQYAPEFVLVSAGFDAHARDPLAGMNVTEEGFAAMARALVRVAEDSAGGRCVAVLEGGYDLRAIRDCSVEVLAELQGREPGEPLIEPASEIKPLLDAIRKIQSRSWKL